MSAMAKIAAIALQSGRNANGRIWSWADSFTAAIAVTAHCPNHGYAAVLLSSQVLRISNFAAHWAIVR